MFASDSYGGASVNTASEFDELYYKLGGWEKWVVSMGDVPLIQEHWGEGKLGICTLEGTKYMEETRMVECYLEVYF